jgi:hypothetical protein
VLYFPFPETTPNWHSGKVSTLRRLENTNSHRGDAPRSSDPEPKINGKFNSNVAIGHSNDEQQIHESIGRFASRDAATLFAVNWALANIKRSESSGLYKN